MYYLLLILLYPIALLPLRALYVLSDIIYVTLYYITGYRKDVVFDNLRHAFPEKSDNEIRLIMKRFYHSFCDQWLETVKMLTISSKELNRRISCNWEVLHELYREGKNTYLLLGHNFNWEWANVAIQYNTQQEFAAVYMPVKNKGFDSLMLHLRSRKGALMISMRSKKALMTLVGTGQLVGLMADQNPSEVGTAMWLPFMHRPAPFYKGPEKLARRAKAAVTFLSIRKEKRGYYHIEVTLLTTDASQLEAGSVTKAYAHFMEAQLYMQPENWLWSHKRWKHKQPS
jgi:KDO2-lipid IV(A) lauroyltransferase